MEDRFSTVSPSLFNLSKFSSNRHGCRQRHRQGLDGVYDFSVKDQAIEWAQFLVFLIMSDSTVGCNGKQSVGIRRRSILK